MQRTETCSSITFYIECLTSQVDHRQVVVGHDERRMEKSQNANLVTEGRRTDVD